MNRKMKNILLFMPPISKWYFKNVTETYSLPPTGLLYLATYLLEHSYNVKIVDLQCNNISFEEFKQQLIFFKPDILGFTLFPDNWDNVHKLLPVLKGIFPEAIFVAGGHLPSFIPKEVLKEIPEIDYVVMGEGEQTLAELSDFLNNSGDSNDIKNILGVCYRDFETGNIIINPRRPSIKDIDSIPFPDRSLIDVRTYTVPFAILTSRGCPGKCVFCSAGAMYETYRKRSTANIMAEIKNFIDRYRAEDFYILDDTFTAHPKQVFELCEGLQKLNHNLKWVCETRADVVTPEMAQEMKKSGCIRVQIGLESADNTILKKIRKGVTIEQIENAIKCFYEADILVFVSFIFGHAWDTKESMYHLIDYAEYLAENYNVKPFHTLNTPYPGTYQYDHCDEIGLKIHAQKWSDFVLSEPTVSTEAFTCEDLQTIQTDAFQRLLKYQGVNQNM